MESQAPESIAAVSSPDAGTQWDLSPGGILISTMLLGMLPLIWLMCDVCSAGLTSLKSAPKKARTLQ